VSIASPDGPLGRIAPVPWNCCLTHSGLILAESDTTDLTVPNAVNQILRIRNVRPEF